MDLIANIPWRLYWSTSICSKKARVRSEVYIVNKNITELGPREVEFLAKIASENKSELTVRSAISYWGSRQIAWKKLCVLEKKGWIARIERGKYIIIPLEAGPQRIWTEDSYLVARVLVQPAVISYWTAIRHWNWTEQIPQIVYVQTTRRKSSSSKTIFGVRYEIITVNKNKFYGHTTEWRSGKKILVTDSEKTIVDYADYPARAGSRRWRLFVNEGV